MTDEMKGITVKDILDNTGGRLLGGTPSVHVSGISTDSRSVAYGDAFFALSGERFDAHDFLADAAAAGASALVVERGEAVPPESEYAGAVVLVADTLAAYQDLAAWYRQEIGPAVIAVTGSVGKTTQKDMIAAAAAGTYRTVATEGNYNNHVGVPKTIFRMEEDTELLVLELGMNHAGEIRLLAEIARPDAAVITNIGVSHRENFDSDDGILHAKLEIATYFGAENALFVNGDDARLRAHAERDDLPYEVVTAGESEGCDYRITHPEYAGPGEIRFVMQSGRDAAVKFSVPAAGLYNGVSAALTAAVLSRSGIAATDVAERLAGLERTAHRLQLIVTDGPVAGGPSAGGGPAAGGSVAEGHAAARLRVIDDTYNASPDSMRSALDYLASFGDGDGRKIAVLAGMNELGGRSRALHREVGEYAAESGADLLVCVGDKGADIAAGFEAAGGTGVSLCADNAEAVAALLPLVRDGDIVLVKGSHAYRTEEIVEALTGGPARKGEDA
jgi:UDP-N-acetylmuramoyl-tripeptide--D-alanyl-D-alanine ligase